MSSPDYGVCTQVIFSAFLPAIFSNMERKRWHVVRKLVAVIVGNRKYVLFEESGCVSLSRFWEISHYHLSDWKMWENTEEENGKAAAGLSVEHERRVLDVENRDSTLH